VTIRMNRALVKPVQEITNNNKPKPNYTVYKVRLTNNIHV